MPVTGCLRQFGIVGFTTLQVGKDEPECERGRVVVNVVEEFRTEFWGDRLVGAEDERFDVEFGGLLCQRPAVETNMYS
jgi:hypothetical protein